MHRWIALVVLLTSLAGCAGDDAPANDADELVPQEVKVEDKKRGAISGVVVDESIRPIAGATVSIRGADGESQSVTSDEAGRFVVEDLDPGLYFLTVTAEGHFEAQQSVEVAAGRVAKPKVLLQIDFTPQPFQETFDFNGILRFSDWYGVYTLTLLMGNTELCECVFDFQVPSTVQSILVEAFWEPNLGNEDHELYFELESADGTLLSEGYSTAPFHRVHPRSLFAEAGSELLVRVSSGVWVDVDQEFELFITLFHLAPAPEGWSIANQSS